MAIPRFSSSGRSHATLAAEDVDTAGRLDEALAVTVKELRMQTDRFTALVRNAFMQAQK